jgi:hypothetical protein
MNDTPTSRVWDWYEFSDGQDLDQGDILRNVPYPVLPPTLASYVEPSKFTAIQVLSRPAIVVSHSCDIAENGGTRDAKSVLFCAVSFEGDGSAEAYFTKGGIWGEIVSGRRKTIFPLHTCVLEKHGFNRAIVNLLDIWTLPIEIVLEITKQQKPVRLLHPYRQEFSQAFARVHMRVEQPIGIVKAS